MFGWLKKNFKSVLLGISLVLNALGGSGIIPPVVAEKGNVVLDAADKLSK
jgi:hypothetical protein